MLQIICNAIIKARVYFLFISQLDFFSAPTANQHKCIEIKRKKSNNWKSALITDQIKTTAEIASIATANKLKIIKFY